jgi:hypothetical protein
VGGLGLGQQSRAGGRGGAGVSAWSSSEDEPAEVFIGGALNKKKRSAPKEYLPKHREPVVNPLSVEQVEERVKRKETRVMNREACRQRKLAMIQ